jgi:hypothetical protein
MSAQRTNSIAGGNATGSDRKPNLRPCKGRIHDPWFDPFRVQGSFYLRDPWALPTAIKFNRSAIDSFQSMNIPPLISIVSPAR